MGIGAKDIGTLFWKILRFSTSTIYTYVRKYPVVSGVAAVIFLLYAFLPWLFYFMLCSSPFIACSAFYLRDHLSFKPLIIKGIKTNNGLSPLSQKESEGGTRKAGFKHQRSVRRNARRKVEEVGKDWDSSQASEDERDKVILTTLYGEFPNTRKSPKLQKVKKNKSFLVAEESSFEPSLHEETPSTTGNVSSVDPTEKLTSGGGETEIECSSSSESEEEAILEDKKVVAWTEDDQKNLMDLGNSEMERNKRLEQLITRRKTRRLVDMEVPSICVGRNYYGWDQGNYTIDGVQMPESAPSVLVPTKNPFDLPYDPQEEKPNLSGDSFQQEFSAANPSDIFFCRHESFCRRTFPLEIRRNSKLEPWKTSSSDGRPRPQQDRNDRLVGEESPLNEGKDLTRAEENDMELEHRTEIVGNDSNSLLSPEEREMDSNVSNQADSFGTFGKQNGDHRVGNSRVGLVPRNSGSSLAAERQLYMDHFGYGTRKGHVVTQSVESDLQVEVSEIGSPPTTIDGNNSSDDEKLFVYESDTGKETVFTGEENEAKEKSIVDITADSQMLPLEKFDQGFNETSSIISPETDAAKQFEGLSGGTDVNRRSEKEDILKLRDSLLESSDGRLLVSEEATVTDTNKVVSQREEELYQNSVNESKIGYGSHEPEPSERRTNQEYEEHFGKNQGGQTAQEIQEIVEPEASNVNQVTPDKSATSPQSVVPPLDQTYTLTSENLELTSDSQARPEPESPQNQLDGYSGNSRETEGRSESNEEAAEEESTSHAIEHDTQGSSVTSN